MDGFTDRENDHIVAIELRTLVANGVVIPTRVLRDFGIEDVEGKDESFDFETALRHLMAWGYHPPRDLMQAMAEVRDMNQGASEWLATRAPITRATAEVRVMPTQSNRSRWKAKRDKLQAAAQQKITLGTLDFLAGVEESASRDWRRGESTRKARGVAWRCELLLRADVGDLLAALECGISFPDWRKQQRRRGTPFIH